MIEKMKIIKVTPGCDEKKITRLVHKFYAAKKKKVSVLSVVINENTAVVELDDGTPVSSRVMSVSAVPMAKQVGLPYVLVVLNSNDMVEDDEILKLVDP